MPHKRSTRRKAACLTKNCLRFRTFVRALSTSAINPAASPCRGLNQLVAGHFRGAHESRTARLGKVAPTRPPFAGRYPCRTVWRAARGRPVAKWYEFEMTHDQSGRLFVARCLRCGHILAGSPDRDTTIRIAEAHLCWLAKPKGQETSQPSKL